MGRAGRTRPRVGRLAGRGRRRVDGCAQSLLLLASWHRVLRAHSRAGPSVDAAGATTCLLRALVVSVVVARRQRVRAHQDAPRYLQCTQGHPGSQVSVSGGSRTQGAKAKAQKLWRPIVDPSPAVACLAAQAGVPRLSIHLPQLCTTGKGRGLIHDTCNSALCQS